MYKVNFTAIKQRLEENKKKATEKVKKKDISQIDVLKVPQAGTYNFRALPYFHNADIGSDPFLERSYHFGIPENAIFYCPKENDGDRCEICEFVWARMKEYKGTDQVKKWKDFLPKKRIVIPGIARGRESEGVKFFLLSTFDPREGRELPKLHSKLIKYLTSASTCDFMDPENGLDFEMTYEAYDAARKSHLGASHGFADFELSRERTPLSEDDPAAAWEHYKSIMKNFDKDVRGYEKKTSDDTVRALSKWIESLDKQSSKNEKTKAVDTSRDSDGDHVVADEDMPQVDTRSVAASPKEDMDERKRKLQERLKSKLNK